MTFQVIVLNGGSSAGKSGIARCLQAVLPEFWAVEAAWRVGVAAMARAGARIILDEVLLGGAEGQERWNSALIGLSVLWVGVHCDNATASAREVARGDRFQGMAASQAQRVHQGVVYDLEVDTTHAEALECAQVIAARVVS